MGYRSILYLDDVRVPTVAGVDHVRSYGEFVEYLKTKGMPELISFDHDLAREHYPVGQNRAGERIPYGDYREGTGLDCARFVVENGLDLKFWAVHSMNVQGRINIERELRAYRRRGEVRGVEIPFVMGEMVAPVRPTRSAPIEEVTAVGTAREPVTARGPGAARDAARARDLVLAEGLGRTRGLGTTRGSGTTRGPETTQRPGMTREPGQASGPETTRAKFSDTSLLQFDEAFALESWEPGRPGSKR